MSKEKTEYRLSAEVQIKLQELVNLIKRDTGFHATDVEFVDHDSKSNIPEMEQTGFEFKSHKSGGGLKTRWIKRSEAVGELDVELTSFIHEIKEEA